MKTEKTVTVIVPCYNMERTLERALDSLLANDLTDGEVIAVDDGSTDQTPHILRRYAQEHACIRVITKRNGGLSSARNAGLDVATGRIIMFMDSDDTVEPTFVSTAVRAMDAPDGPDLLTFGININGGGAFPQACPEGCADRETVLRTYFPLVLGYTARQFDDWLRTGRQGTREQGWVPRCAFRHDIIRRHHLRFPAHFTAGEDQMFLASYALHARTMRHIPEVLYHYDVKPTGLYLQNIRGCHMAKSLQNKINLLEERMRLAAIYRELVPSDARALYVGSCLFSALQLGVLSARRLGGYSYFHTYAHIPEVQACVDSVSLPKWTMGGVKRLLPVFLLKHGQHRLLFALFYVAGKLGIRPGLE